MKLGTKIGWILVAFSVILSVWVISGVGSKADKSNTDGFSVSDSGTNAGTLTAYPTTWDIVDIPSKIEDQNVTSILQSLFYNNTTVKSVSMPITITSLGDNVFEGCTNLETVSLSDGLTTLPKQAFLNCENLGGGTLGNGTVDLKNVEIIENEAFKGCKSLTSITLNSKTSSAPGNAFDGCRNLASINVGSTGTGDNYSSYDGCLYNKNGSILLRVPEGKTGTMVIPDTCTSVYANAFKNSQVTEVTVPASTTFDATQEGWVPTVIHGVSGSPAQTFAETLGVANGVTWFDGSGGSGGGGATTWTVSFNSNGGAETYADQDVADGDVATNPGTPTKSGATFNGWYNGSTAWDFATPVTEDLTLTANWTEASSGTTDSGSGASSGTATDTSSTTEKTYTVTFNLNGGSGNSTSQKVVAGQHAKNPGNPTKTGCTFMGWDYGSAAGDLWNFDVYQVNWDVTLTAVWKNADGSISKGSTKSGGSTGNSGHVKDSTPKTADGDLDPRYFLSLSFLLMGIAAILYSKRQKTQMISERRNR